MERKDHSANGLQPGYVTDEMIRWRIKKKKATGRLDVFLDAGKSIYLHSNKGDKTTGVACHRNAAGDLNADLNRQQAERWEQI